MQNDDDKAIEPSEIKSSSKIDEKTLFSEKEIKAIVKDFIAAYISGQITIHFPNAEDLMDMARREGGIKDFKQASKEENNLKMNFRTRMATCVGAIKSTPEEQMASINGFFETIIAMRNGGRIIGVFTEYPLEVRIKRLEEGLEVTNNLVKEIVEWIYRGTVEK
jgi:hypothetical protein